MQAMSTSLKRTILVITLGLLLVTVALLVGSAITTHASGQPTKQVCSTSQALPPSTKLPAPTGLPAKGIGTIGFSQAPGCLPCPPLQTPPAGTPTGAGTLPLSNSPCPASGKK